MKNQTSKLKKKLCIWIPSVLVFALVVFCVVYVNDYYRAESHVDAYLQSGENVIVTVEDHIVFLDGTGEETALIFYPGAKVEYTAYVPMFYALAEQGIDCFIVKMPGNLAILGMNKAESIMQEHEYENWYLSGHSLGGAMAANFAADASEKPDGLVLLAAYPTKDLTGSGLSVLSVYGSEDKVLNAKKLEEGRALMPEDYTELCLEGGNHAWFAYYGEQAGDGVATITREEQQTKTIEAILDMIQ